MYKVVDSFNGGVIRDSISNYKDAESILDNHRQALYALPGNQNIIYKGVIVRQEATWSFSQRENKFIWE